MTSVMLDRTGHDPRACPLESMVSTDRLTSTCPITRNPGLVERSFMNEVDAGMAAF